MDIDFGGIIYIWLNLLWIIFWPVPFAIIYLILFRKTISRKIIFFLIAVAAAFVINYIFEFAFLKLFITDPKDPNIEKYFFENARVYSLILLGFKIPTSLLLYHYLKSFKFFHLRKTLQS